jgi:hypothetical protein
MAVDVAERSRNQERVIDTYWAQGMSLDPILKTETISETKAYLTNPGEEDWREKDYVDRGVELGDLDQIDDKSCTLTARAMIYQKAAASTSTMHSATRTTRRGR